MIGAGAAGSVLAGRWADRLGRERVTIWAMAASGACALLMGWLLSAPAWLAVGVGLVWGFSVVADSAQFSAVVTEVAPAHAVGTALTLQTALGIRATDMTPEQRDRLIDLISEHVGNLRDGHAAVRMAEVRERLDETYFGWIGGTEPNSVFYYRIHSPVILIEFDHQRPIGLRGGDREQPRRAHIHSIVRTPNGNDYGKDLLRQHYEQHPAPHRHP